MLVGIYQYPGGGGFLRLAHTSLHVLDGKKKKKKKKKKKTFCGFPWVVISTAGRIYNLCVLLYDGSTQRLTKSSFMEKPGIKHATAGLQGIGVSPSPRRLLKNCLWLFHR